jgi:hypothetical protein
VNLTVPAIEALVNMAAAKAAMLPSNVTLLPEVTAMLSMTKLPSVDLSAITGMLTKPNIDLSGLTVSCKHIRPLYTVLLLAGVALS